MRGLSFPLDREGRVYQNVPPVGFSFPTFLHGDRLPEVRKRGIIRREGAELMAGMQLDDQEAIDIRSLDAFFEPSSVAVVGASRDEGKVGYGVLKNLLDVKFAGEVYPVNPKADEILGIRCYPSVADVPGSIELAVMAIPARFVVDTLHELGKKGTKAAIVITAGFKESGKEGARLEEALVEAAKEEGIRIIGPNCLGVIDTFTPLNASFAANTPARGGIAFFSQSGALCTAILDWSLKEDIGFSKFISLGNKADVDELDMLMYLAEDPHTDVVLGYIEGVKNGSKFLEVAREVTRRKPVIIAKSGRTKAGARAASSHTGTLAGSEQAFQAAFLQGGIIRADSVQDLFDFASAFLSHRKPSGKRVVVVTNAGGPGIVAADAVESSQLEMASLSEETTEKLRSGLPPTAALQNPVDVIGDADASRYRHALEQVSRDENVDMVLTILTPQAMTRPMEVARILAETAARADKPFAASFMGGPAVAEAVRYLKDHAVPNFDFPDRAVQAMEALYRFSVVASREDSGVPRFDFDNDTIRAVFEDAKSAGRRDVADTAARRVLEACGLKTPATRIAADADAAVQAAEEMGYPVVMKIASPDILHKSDIGGVEVGLSSAEEVRTAFERIMENARTHRPEADLEGVAVQQMLEGGREVIVGSTRDPQFGPMIMFGLGGIYVEVLKDVSFRIAPLRESEARGMVEQIRTYPLLKGVRGEAPVDIDALVEVILRVSQLVCDYPEIMEMDINPLVLFPGEKGAVAVDARISVE